MTRLPSRKMSARVFAPATHGSAPSPELTGQLDHDPTNECRVRSFAGCDVPQRGQFHADPSPLSPGPSNTNGERCASRTEEDPRDQQSVGRLSTRSTGLADSRNCVETQRGTSNHGILQWFFDERDMHAVVRQRVQSRAPCEVCAPSWFRHEAAAYDEQDQHHHCAANRAPLVEEPHHTPEPPYSGCGSTRTVQQPRMPAIGNLKESR